MAAGPPPPPQNAVMRMNASIKSFSQTGVVQQWDTMTDLQDVENLFPCPGNGKINITEKVSFTLGCTNHRCFLKVFFFFKVHCEFTTCFCLSFSNPTLLKTIMMENTCSVLACVAYNTRVYSLRCLQSFIFSVGV